MKQETKSIAGMVVIPAILIFGAFFAYSKLTQANNMDNTISNKTEDVLIRPDSHKIEAVNAKVTVVEFSDFECPACRVATVSVKEIMKKYEGKITFVYRNFPLRQHPYALLSAEAAEVAGVSGKYWEMHEMLFDNQDTWAIAPSEKEAKDIFVSYAEKLGLDKVAFAADLNSMSHQEFIKKDLADGESLDIRFTPTFFVNGRMVVGGSEMVKAVGEEMAK
jgi:protein-disulfide isomerase